MNTDKNNKNLDELIKDAIGQDGLKFDFNKWKNEHKKEVQIYKSQTSKQKIHPARIYRIGKIIMKSKLSKITTAAAVILIAVVSIFFLDKSVAPVYGITDMPVLYEQAKVIHIQGMKYFGSHRMPDGSEIPPVPLDNWFDLENGRSRFTGTGLTDDGDFVSVSVSEKISDNQYMMSINHKDKNVMFFKRSHYQQMYDAYNTSRMTQQQIFGGIEQLRNFEKINIEQIDGIIYDIWQGEEISSNPGVAFKKRFWISPETGRIGRVQLFSNIYNGEWSLEFDYSKIEYDVEIPDNIFSMNVPEDYELKNTKDEPIILELTGSTSSYGDDLYNLKASVLIGFRLPNDSIVTGWFSLDFNSELSQDNYFTDLEYGGSLPELPVKIYGLKSISLDKDLTYTGYHLAYTQKNDQFCEWSLYVPDETISLNENPLYCNILYKFNLDPKPSWGLGLIVDCSMLIKNTEDFEKWVLGAMKELSNNGEPPKNITYEKIIKLSEQIREKINQ